VLKRSLILLGMASTKIRQGQEDKRERAPFIRMTKRIGKNGEQRFTLAYVLGRPDEQ
jgi:hypothetical protein